MEDSSWLGQLWTQFFTGPRDPVGTRFHHESAVWTAGRHWLIGFLDPNHHHTIQAGISVLRRLVLVRQTARKCDPPWRDSFTLHRPRLSTDGIPVVWIPVVADLGRVRAALFRIRTRIDRAWIAVIALVRRSRALPTDTEVGECAQVAVIARATDGRMRHDAGFRVAGVGRTGVGVVHQLRDIKVLHAFAVFTAIRKALIDLQKLTVGVQLALLGRAHALAGHSARVANRIRVSVIALCADQRGVRTARGRHARVCRARIGVVAIRCRTAHAFSVLADVARVARVAVVARLRVVRVHATLGRVASVGRANVFVVAVQRLAHALAVRARVARRASRFVVARAAHGYVQTTLLLVADVVRAGVRVVAVDRRGHAIVCRVAMVTDRALVAVVAGCSGRRVLTANHLLTKTGNAHVRLPALAADIHTVVVRLTSSRLLDHDVLRDFDASIRTRRHDVITDDRICGRQRRRRASAVARQNERCTHRDNPKLLHDKLLMRAALPGAVVAPEPELFSPTNKADEFLTL